MLSPNFLRNLILACGLIILFLNSSSCKGPSEKTLQISVVVTDSLTIRKTDSLYRRAKDLFGERKFVAAKALFEQVDSLFLSQERYPTFLIAKINQSTNLRALEAPDDTILKVLKEALHDVRNEPPTTFEIGSVYNAISATYLRTEDYLDAEYYGRKAMAVFNHPSNVDEKEKIEELQQSYDRLATAEQGLFNYDKAEEYYKKTLASEVSRAKETTTLAKLFGFYEFSGKYDEAKVLLDTVSWESRLQEASFFDKYIFQISKLDLQMALERYEAGLTTAMELDAFIASSPYGGHFTNWYLDQRLAHIYLKMEEYDKVIAVVDNIKLAPGEEQLKNKGNSPHLLYQSKAYFKKGDIKKAQEVLQEAINLHFPQKLKAENFFESIDLVSASIRTKLVGKLLFKAEICRELYTTSGKDSYLTAALENYQLVHQLFKEIGATSEEDQFLKDAAFKSFYEEYLSALHIEWEAAKQEDLFYQALTVSEEARNISVLKELKQINRDKLFRNIPTVVREQQLKFEQSLDSLSRVIPIALDPTADLQIRDSIITQFNQFKQTLKTEHPNYYELLYGGRVPVSTVIATKYADYNVIEYFVGDRNMFIFNVNNGHQQFDKIEFTVELKNALSQLIGSLRNPKNMQYSESLALVYEAILAKYNSGDKKLALVLDGELYALPFEVLTQMKEAMLLKQPTLRLNSISQSGQITESAGNKALAFAPYASVGMEGRNKISNSLNEVEFIKNTFGGSVKIDQEATKKAFLENATQFPILHLATHSEVNKKIPLRSAIYFTPEKGKMPSEQSLELQELYNMTLSAELVTLSSCETGIGKEVKGKGIQSISNAFSYAGVGSTVMSLWKVPDRQTTQLMISFYEHLGKGEAKDVALHRAKKDYLANTSDVNLRHPYYWAGFVISGDTTPIQISAPTNRYVAWGALILGTVGLGLFYFRRKKKRA